MPKYYFRRSNNFLDFNENQVSNLYPNENWMYRLLEEEHLTRLNDNVYKQKTYDYVFNGTIPEVPIEQIRGSKLGQLENNYSNKQLSGSVVSGMHFDLTDETKGQVADWNQVIEKDRNNYLQNSGSYDRIFLTASMTDISGSQKLITDDNWDNFFMNYSVSYATLKMSKKAKERQINILSGSNLENFDVSL